MPSRARLEPRDRSRVVCQRCHARKVKCDLAAKLELGGKCTNCVKRLENCNRRQQTKFHRQNRDRRRPQAQHLHTGAPQQLSPETSPTSPIRTALQSPSVTSDGLGYVGELSVMSNQRMQPFQPSNDAFGSILHSRETLAILTTQADQLPPQPVIDALAEIYFQYLYHRMPVVNHSDLSTSCSSKLLQQSLCLAGSVLRHPRTTHEPTAVRSESFYASAKSLFYNNHEKDPMNVLKSLCLLTLWNVTPPAVITFDCGWSWLGMALRLALQMGLHKESTYTKRSDPGAARRIAWFLYAQDKLHAACFGRPQMLRHDEFDLSPPATDDFEPAESSQAGLFVSYTDLASILGRISLLQNKELPQASQEVLSVMTKLREWANKIPSDLQIFGDDGSLIYQRGTFEVLIWYFTCLVNFFHTQGPFFHPSVASTISLVASSCAIRLYQEMDYRDDINYLVAISNWSMMVVSLPQLNETARQQHSITMAEERPLHGYTSLQELDILLGIIENRTVKYPGAQALVLQLNDLRKQAQQEILDPVETPVPTTQDGSYLTIHQIRDFFPFPENFAPCMGLLQALETDEQLDELGRFTEWTFETLMNMENLDSFL